MYTRGKLSVSTGGEPITIAQQAYIANMVYANGDSEYCIIIDSPTKLVTKDKANAARICHCVNNFDELLAACKEALSYFEDLAKTTGFNRSILNTIRKVIAKAEKQG